MKEKAKLMTAREIAKEVGDGMGAKNVYNLMRNREPLHKIPWVIKNGRIFFKIKDIEAIAGLWQETQKRREYLSTGDMAKWLIAKGCPFCPEDLTKLAKKGVIPAKKIGWFWGFNPEDRELILVKIKNRQREMEESI